MDAQRFDALIRRFFSTATSRRSGLRIVPAAVAMALGFSTGEADAKKGGKKKRKKKKNGGQQQVPPPDPNNQNPVIVNECQGDADCDRRYLKGLNCVSGQCVCKAGGNCTGCCKSAKVCILKENQNFTACGLGGGPCEECNPYVGCNPDKGYCECTGSFCDGCCTDNNKRCRKPGTEDKFCGRHTICVDCTTIGVGKVCQYNGTCCVPLGKACDDANHCCAAAGVSCLDNVCKNI